MSATVLKYERAGSYSMAQADGKPEEIAAFLATLQKLDVDLGAISINAPPEGSQNDTE